MRPDGDSDPGRPSMKEVAERAGVAISSVSRVIGGHPDVSAVMRNRVLDAVAALGYEPNVLAQSLRTGSTRTIGFVIGDISNPLMSQIALACEIRLRQAGYTTLLTNSLNDVELDVAHLRLLQQRRADGLLVSLSDESDPEVIGTLGRTSTPLVLIDREVQQLPDLAAVLSDHASGIAAAAEHLISLGHRRIALINGNPNVRPTRERARAVRRVCRRHEGVTVVLRSHSFTDTHGYAATLDVLDAAQPATALIAGSNQILTGVLRALRERGLRVPEDVSLVTCDDVALAEFLTPEISTITRDTGEIGQLAAELLLEQIESGRRRQAVLPTDFRVTASCAPPGRTS